MADGEAVDIMLSFRSGRHVVELLRAALKPNKTIVLVGTERLSPKDSWKTFMARIPISERRDDYVEDKE